MGNASATAGLFIAGFIALKLMGAAFIVLLIVRIAAALRGRSDGARETASRRFAAGEITEDQFRRIRDVLDS
jgi:uncharacterized membrane protein